MVRLQQLPNVLPTNVMFSTESIYIDDGLLYPVREESYLNTGSSFFIDNTLKKYTLTIGFGQVIVDCLLVGINNTSSQIPTLYPIAFKVYKPYVELFRQNKSTILLRNGIEAVLSLCSSSLENSNLMFVSKRYMKIAMETCYPEDSFRLANPFSLDGILSENVDLLGYTSDINLLNYVNNENNPGSDFSFDWFMHELQLNGIRFPADPSRHIDMAGSYILDTFSPSIPKVLLVHPLTSTLITCGAIEPAELISKFGLSSVTYSDSLFKDSTISDIITSSHTVHYAGCLANSFKDESFEMNVYSLYEKLQTFPYLDGYIRYILLNSNNLEVDSSVSFLGNYYTSFLEKNLTGKEYLIEDVKKEISSIIEFNPYGKVESVEIIIRDYIVLVVFTSCNKQKWTLVFDLVILAIMSKTLMITDEHNYLNGEFISSTYNQFY